MIALILLAGFAAMPASQASLRREQPLAEQSVKKVLGATEKVVKQSRFNFNAGVCFGVAVLDKGDKIQTRYALERGVRYLFIGGGDVNAQNVDLAVLDAKGKAVAQDNAPDAVPVVFFTPKYSGTYHMALRLKKGKAASSFCSLVVMRKTGGYALPISSIRDAIKPSDQLSPEMNQLADSLRFHRGRNQWTAFGAVLKQGDTTRLPGLKYETGTHIFVGGTDGRATEIDLALLNSAGRKLVESKKAGASPILIHETNGSQTYQLTIANRRSKGASLVTLIAVDIKGNGTSAAASGSSTPRASGDITVQLNGKVVTFESGGAIELNGRVMVPLSELFQAMGGEVELDSSDNSYSITDGDDEIVLKIGSPVVTVNGNSLRMDTPPIMYQGTAMVPLRFFIQAAGADVKWDGKRRTVFITIAE